MASILLLASAGAIITRKIVQKTLAKKIVEARDEVRYRVSKNLLQSQYSAYIGVIINVVAILVGAYILPLFFDSTVVVLSICVIYFSSVLNSLWNTIRLIPTVGSIIFSYHGNLYEYIRDRIYSQIHDESRDEINKLSLIPFVFNSIFGKNAQQIASEITEIAFPEVIGVIIRRLVQLLFVMFIYIGLFSFFIRPILIKETTGLGMMQAFLYPFLWSIDLMIGTDFVTLLL